VPEDDAMEMDSRSGWQGKGALEDGCLVAPQSPGLGLTLDVDAVRPYSDER